MPDPGFLGERPDIVDLNVCQVCGVRLSPDDYNGICCDCDDEICDSCGGEGWVEDYSRMFPRADDSWPMVRCPLCKGSGRILNLTLEDPVSEGLSEH